LVVSLSLRDCADLDAVIQIARRLETGICHINDATVNDEPPMPFGGVKHS
jgi:acyl-CoA reductase-like NAD-dependent aldehyde dehydrogenase